MKAVSDVQERGVWASSRSSTALGMVVSKSSSFAQSGSIVMTTICWYRARTPCCLT